MKGAVPFLTFKVLAINGHGEKKLGLKKIARQQEMRTVPLIKVWEPYNSSFDMRN